MVWRGGLQKYFVLERVRSLTFNGQCYHHIETSQLICRVKQLAGFSMLGTLVVKRLNRRVGNISKKKKA